VFSIINTKNNLFFQLEIKREKNNASFLETSFIVLISLALVLLIIVLFIIRYQLSVRKQAEILLEENKYLLRSIIENTTNPIFIKTINGQYILSNKQFGNLFHPKEKVIKGKTDHQIFSKETADKIRSSDLEVVKAKKEMVFEEVIDYNNKSNTYIMVKFPIFDAQNNIYAIGGIATDITERKKTDLSIKESEAQVQMIIDAGPDAVIVINEESKIIQWNKKAEELFKWTATEALGKIMYDLIMPERYKKAYLEGMKHFILTGEGPVLNKAIEVSAINKNKEEFNIELTISYAKHKEKYIFIAFLKDITKRKLLEQESMQSKYFLNSIIENIPDMIFVKDAKGLTFVTFNKAGEKLLGYTREEMIGKNDYDFFPEVQADFFTENDRLVLKIGNVVDIGEEEIDTKNGKRLLHTKKIPIKDEQGKPIYLLGISEDITEKKQLAKERTDISKKLRENEKRMTLILENIGEGVLVIDIKQKVVLANQMARDILDIHDSILEWEDKYDLYYPDGHTVYPSQNLPIERALKGEATNDIEIILADRDSNIKKRIQITGRPIKDENNIIIAAVATIKNITKFKELEKALEESETKFRKLIGFRRNP
jgi:PAS domain S-box-containing protein